MSEHYKQLAAHTLKQAKRKLPEIFDVHIETRINERIFKKNATINFGGDTIAIDMGLLLALEDVILSVAAQDDFLSNHDEDDGPAEVLRSATWTFQPSFDRIGELDAAMFIDFRTLSSAMPLERWRLMQCQYLFEAAFQFVFLHELSHWALGHTVYAREALPFATDGLDELHMGTVAAGSRQDAEIQARCQSLELLADSEALDFLVTMNFNPDEQALPGVSFQLRHGRMLRSPAGRR